MPLLSHSLGIEQSFLLQLGAHPVLIVTPKNGIQGRTRGTKQKESQAKALESQTSCAWNSQKNLRNKPMIPILATS